VEHLELILLFLLLSVAGLTALAHRLDVPYPILLVIGGSILGFAPGVPEIELAPELVLLVFLPPLLFNAAYFASFRDLRRQARAITLSAVLLVLATMCVVAVVLHAAVPGLPWAAAFAFGAIVSPTDPLAAIAITQRLGAPRRVTTLIEGESLINDGTALVAYRTAVAAAVGGSFDLLDASGDFVVNVAGGVAVGLVAAYAVTFAARRAGDDMLQVTIGLLAPYVAYLPAEHVHVSGVIAAVTAGLLVGRNAYSIMSAGQRLRAHAFWEVLVFLLNALLFVLVGLQLPGILEDQERSALELTGLALLASLAVIGTRLSFSMGMPHVVRALDRRPSQRARRVGWRPRMVIAWSGLRGAVSLAAALALPPGFPERDLLIFLTLAVVFATLVGQGLTLPVLMRRLGVEDDGEFVREEQLARQAAARAAIERLQAVRDADWTRDQTVDRMISFYEFRGRLIEQRFRADGEMDLVQQSTSYQRLQREIIAAQRDELIRLRDGGEITDAVVSAIERELDLEEDRLYI
jgi:monovalent cation/hydrogen antiporter